jgi:hypothetical protein
MSDNILDFTVLLIDILTTAFLIWRISKKNATLWGASRIIYGWIALTAIYHAAIYGFQILFPPLADAIRHNLLLPFVALYTLNPLLIGLIHWRGGRLL